MTTDHPITPPPELVQGWWEATQKEKPERRVKHIVAQSAQWGADQELELCANWLADPCAADMPSLAKDLRYSRRPKPPSLAEEAHDALGRFFSNAHTQASQMTQDFEILRRAVERLQELENNG